MKQINLTYTTKLLLGIIAKHGEEKENLIYEVLTIFKQKFPDLEINYKTVFHLIHYLDRENYLCIDYCSGKISLTPKGKNLMSDLETKEFWINISDLFVMPYNIQLFMELVKLRGHLLCISKKVPPVEVLELMASKRIDSRQKLNEFIPDNSELASVSVWEKFLEIMQRNKIKVS